MISYLKYLKHITWSLLKNYRRIFSLAIFEYKLTNKEMFLGQLWKLLNPFIQIGAYWLVFGIGIRQNREIDGIQYVVWLTTGYTAWFMINRGITIGANSIYQKGNLITRSNIPAFIIPVSDILAVVMDSLWTIGLMFIIFFAYGYSPNIHMLNLLYYTIYSFAFIVSISFIFSALVMLARDFRQIVAIVMRLMFFLSPITWRPGDNMPAFYKAFHKYNPIAYAINGFRDSMLYNKDFYSNLNDLRVFLILLLVLYLIGAACQKKLRNNILDYL